MDKNKIDVPCTVDTPAFRSMVVSAGYDLPSRGKMEAVIAAADAHTARAMAAALKGQQAQIKHLEHRRDLAMRAHAASSDKLDAVWKDIENIVEAHTGTPVSGEPMDALEAALAAAPQQHAQAALWILTREINDYSQDGEYYVAAWMAKPSAEQLRQHISYEDDVQKALTEGGGRIGSRGTWYYLREEIASQQPAAAPDLSPVIQWLENGCDPKEAAKELRLYQKAMDHNAAPKKKAATLICGQCGTDRIAAPCPNMADECAMRADAHLAAPSPVQREVKS